MVLTDGEWTCDQPLARYAESLGGELPLKVTARFTRPVETVAGIVDLTSGCTGDGSDAIDLILDIQGDGRTVGGTGDALTVKIEATDIDITGSIDCGPRGPGAHQDGIQALGANDIAFVDLEVGDWDEQRATCTGASAGSTSPWAARPGSSRRTTSASAARWSPAGGRSTSASP